VIKRTSLVIEGAARDGYEGTLVAIEHFHTVVQWFVRETERQYGEPTPLLPQMRNSAFEEVFSVRTSIGDSLALLVNRVVGNISRAGVTTTLKIFFYRGRKELARCTYDLSTAVGDDLHPTGWQKVAWQFS